MLSKTPQILKIALAGEIQKLTLPKSLFPFLDALHSKIKSAFPEGEPELISTGLPFLSLNKRMNDLRASVYADRNIKNKFIPILEYLEIPVDEFYSDLFRLRCVPSFFHKKEGSELVQYLHRDPWYANPQCQLNFWIPLSDVSPGSGFGIYPEYFQKPIQNNSYQFDYNHWLETGGFQANESPKLQEKIFPKPDRFPDNSISESIYGSFGDVIVFSSHHLHGTQDNVMNRSRFSLEIRFVLKEWIQNKLGPKNLDNFSKGSTLGEMRQIQTDETLDENLIRDYVAEFDRSQNTLVP